MNGPNEPFRLSIHGCARCQGDGHEDLLWQPLTNPVALSNEEIDGPVTYAFTHWALCPTNGEPILMRTDA